MSHSRLTHNTQNSILNTPKLGKHQNYDCILQIKKNIPVWGQYIPESLEASPCSSTIHTYTLHIHIHTFSQSLINSTGDSYRSFAQIGTKAHHIPFFSLHGDQYPLIYNTTALITTKINFLSGQNKSIYLVPRTAICP